MTATHGQDATNGQRSECWCCGTTQPVDKMVHLGNHPEVGVCTRCAHSIHKWAREIEDRARTGAAVRARDAFRTVRNGVVRRGWHQSRFIGRPVRWIGRYLP